MKHRLALKVGPIGYRIGSAWPGPLAALGHLYADYPAPAPGALLDYTVRLEPPVPWRRWLRPSLAIAGDYQLPDAAPLPLAHGLVAAEMGMNLQLALAERRFLLLHAATVERGGRALILTGESGAGKSTLSAMLGEADWRFMGDEFALLAPATGQLHPFPRAVSLKNQAIDVMTATLPAARFGPVMANTPKGTIRHLRANTEAVRRMAEPARPALILFPRFGLPAEIRPVGPAEAFMRLTQASTNYVALGVAGYRALTALVRSCPAAAIDYPDGAEATRLIDLLWSELP